MPIYKVNFTTFTYAQTATPNSFKVKGTGMVTVEPRMMVISFKTGGFLGLGASAKVLEFPFEYLVNVERIGNSVRFEIPHARVSLGWAADSKNVPFFQFWAKNEAEASAIVDALPHAKTAEVAQRLAEEANFEEQLKATTPTPWVSPALVAINFAVFGMMAVAGAGIIKPDAAVHIAWGSNFGPYTTDGQWWRLFTSMFLHFGLIHLALNMWALWDLGRLAERLYGSWVFLALYILAGLAGSIASVAWTNDVNSAGASGAIFGVLGALLAYMLDKRNEVPASVMTRHRNATFAFIAYSLAYGFSQKGIDNAAHIGGLVAGVILGFAMARPLDPARRQGVARIAIPIAIATVVLILLTLPLRGVGEHFREDQKFQQVLNAAIDRETGSLAAAKKIADESAKRLLTDEQGFARFEREVVMPYRQSATELGSIRLDSSSKAAELYQVMTRYFNGRAEAHDMLLDGMRRNDDIKIKLAHEKVLEGNRIVAEYNAKKSARK